MWPEWLEALSPEMQEVVLGIGSIVFCAALIGFCVWWVNRMPNKGGRK